MGRSKKIKDSGYVFETTGTEFEDISTKDLEGKSISFDAHEITGKIIEFGKILTGLSLYDYQYDIAYSVIYSVVTFSGDVKTVLLSRQSGKSEVMAFIIDTLTVLMPALAQIIPDLEQFKTGFRVGLFAPQSDQVNTTYSRALTRLDSANAEMIMSDPDIGIYATSDVRLELSNGSFLMGQTASKQSKIESKTYDLVIIEEAQDVDDFLATKSIEPMVTATGGTIVKVGTTGTHKNHFWTEIQYNRNTDRREKDKRVRNHLEFAYKQIISDRRKQYAIDSRKFHLNYEADVLRKRERWGEESQEFKLAFALIWDLESGMLITDKEYNRLTNRKKGFGIPRDNDYIVAGMDIGKSPASTVITIMKVHEREDIFERPVKEILAWVDLGGLDYEAQHHAVLDAIVEYNVSTLFVDYTGVGKPVVDRLIYACGEFVNIEPYPFTAQSKSDMWYSLVTDINTKSIIIPANKIVRGTKEYMNFEEQMKNCQKYFNGAYMVCEKSDGYYDDYVDSLGLACLAGNDEQEVEMEMEVLDNHLYKGVRDVLGAIKRNSY